MDVMQAILQRRTVKDFTGEGTSRQNIEQLLELAVWAPNHRLTQPWHFFVVPQERVADLAQALIRAIRDDDAPKLLRKREVFAERVPRLAAFITVARKPVPDDPETNREDYAACCCAVQNILLGAVTFGLAGYWNTGRIFDRPAVREFLQIPSDLERVASIWLGVPAVAAKSARIPARERTHWL